MRIQYWVTTNATFIYLVLMAVFSVHAQTNLELDNDTLHLKLDLTKGGAIGYISNSGTERNIVNINNEGRYIQQSYSAGNKVKRQGKGQKSEWSPWSWNPKQTGDSYGNSARILEYKKAASTLYVKCVPMLWDMKNKYAEAEMEQWTTLSGNVIKVRNKLSCHRTDTIYGEGILNKQELPAVYPISYLKNLYTYVGNVPFTGAPVEKLEVQYVEDGSWGKYVNDTITESWMAFVDDEEWGMAVYTPKCANFLAGISGESGFEATDESTSYIAPIKKEVLNRNTVYEYDYYLIIGTLEEIRTQVYRLKSDAD